MVLIQFPQREFDNGLLLFLSLKEIKKSDPTNKNVYELEELSHAFLWSQAMLAWYFGSSDICGVGLTVQVCYGRVMPWPNAQPPRVRSECLLQRHLRLFSLPSHWHISFTGTEFTQFHVFVVFVGFLVFLALVSKVLSEDLHPVGAPSGWDRTERLSCL